MFSVWDLECEQSSLCMEDRDRLFRQTAAQVHALQASLRGCPVRQGLKSGLAAPGLPSGLDRTRVAVRQFGEIGLGGMYPILPARVGNRAIRNALTISAV